MNQRWSVLAMLLWGAPVFAQHECQPAGNGWERCFYRQQALPRFFSLLESRGLQGITVDRLPFGRSVGVLVGVSRYASSLEFADLRFVDNDIAQMKSYLLGPGGFDEVWTLRDDDVSASAVETLMRNTLKDHVGLEDRVLFYFSGHGFDYGGQTGYLAFGSAKRNHYDSNAMLPVSHIREWSSVLKSRHVLFVLDACSSGLGITTKSVEMRSRPDIVLNTLTIQRSDDRSESDPSNLPPIALETLSRNGSRAAITAGTGDERALASRDGRSSLFTRLLLTILTDPSSSGLAHSGLLTAETVWSKVRTLVSVEAASVDQRMTPQYWADEKKGSFLFLDPGNSPFTRDVANALFAKLPGLATAPQVRRWQDIAVRYDLQRVSAESMLLDLGTTPAGRRTVNLIVENQSASALEVSVRAEGNGLNPEFQGSSRTARIAPEGRADLQVTLDTGELQANSRLAIVGDGVVFAQVAFRAAVVPPSQTVTVDSGPRPSGAREGFSPWYPLCADAPRPNLEFEPGSDRFFLSGDRSCGSWSECRRSVSAPNQVCWEFRLQGHNEGSPFDQGVRQSNGNLQATFRQRASAIRLTAGGN